MLIEDIKVDLQVDEEVEVQLTDPPPKLAELVRGVWLPVRVIAEYPQFFTVDVLPHINPIQSWGLSTPYKLTLSKIAIMFGEVKIRR